MLTTTLRRVGGSVMLTVPPAILDLLHLRAGETVGVTVDGGRLVIEPRQATRYSLEDLLAQCYPSAEANIETDALDRAWFADLPVGRELL